MKRRLILCALLFAVALCAATVRPGQAAELPLLGKLRSLLESSSQRASAADVQAFRQAICDAYKVSTVDQLRGRVSIALLTSTKLSDNPLYFEYGADTISADSAASAIKVAILVYYAHLLETGAATADTVTQGRSLQEHAKRMVRNSDNASANALMDYLGMDAINAWYASLGFPAGELRLRRHFSGNPSADPAVKDNHASARALTLLYFLIAQQVDVPGFLNSASLKAVRSMLSNGAQGLNTTAQFNDRLNGKFPRGVVFMHKTGSNTEVIADAGIVSNYLHGASSFVIVAFDAKLSKPAMQRLGLNLLKLMKQRAQL